MPRRVTLIFFFISPDLSNKSTLRLHSSFFFFFNDTATTEIYTLSLHDALPICGDGETPDAGSRFRAEGIARIPPASSRRPRSDASPSARAAPRGLRREDLEELLRSEEHTSELQSHLNLVCRLLLEKKKSKQLQH